MRKTIDGIAYDTEKSALIYEIALYKTTDGQWFVVDSGDGDNLSPLHEAEARCWLEEYAYDEVYVAHFPDRVYGPQDAEA